MALRAAGLSLGVSRYLAGGSGGWSRLGGAVQQEVQAFCSAGQERREEEDGDQQRSAPGFPSQLARGPAKLPTAMMSLQAQLASQEAQRQQPASASVMAAAMKACGSSSRGPLLPARPARRQLLPGMARPLLAAAPLALAPSLQTRAYNAWSPAQRYFVEGDHVISAEANRMFQFTGLDGGSFYPYVVATIIATAISTVFMVLPLVVAPSRVDLDKSSAYECGFDAFGEARQTFSVSFYLVSIMYLLFDIEIAYLFPYAMTHASVPMYWTMNLFLAILVAGFAYEWGMGALEWRE